MLQSADMESVRLTEEKRNARETKRTEFDEAVTLRAAKWKQSKKGTDNLPSPSAWLKKRTRHRETIGR